MSHNYQRLNGHYYILNGDGRFVKNDKDFAVFPNSFLKGLLINDDIDYIGMNSLDKVEDKYKPLAIAMVDTNMGRKEDFVSKQINLLKVYSLRLIVMSVVTLMTLYVIEAILYHCNGLPFNGYEDGIRYTWGKPVYYNSFGFRDDEWKTEYSKYRVMVLGDSFTWGAGLDNSQRFTELCEDDEIEVMNFGKSGYDFTDYCLVLGDYVDLFEPDLVVVAYCINDTQIHQTNYSPKRDSWERKYRNKYNKVFSSMSLDEVGK